MRGSRYTILFAVTLSATCSILLSGIYMLLKERQDENRSLEKQQSILSAAKIKVSDKSKVKEIYQKRVKELVLNFQGEIVKNADPAIVGETSKDLLLLYRISQKDDRKKVLGYVYPVVGAGLWSKLYGYLAVDKTGRDIVGITFYKQGETPGLGAEIEKPWFTQNFAGKTLFDKDKLVGVRVAKGTAKLDPAYKYDGDRLVDGISGATITGNGVSAMLVVDPLKYEPFFIKERTRM